MKHPIKNEKGITILALLLSIVLLLVIAGVGIYFLVKKNGIINQTIETQSLYTQEDAQEEVEILYKNLAIKKKVDSGYNTLMEDFREDLKKKDEKATANQDEDGTIHVLYKKYNFSIVNEEVKSE